MIVASGLLSEILHGGHVHGRYMGRVFLWDGKILKIRTSSFVAAAFLFPIFGCSYWLKMHLKRNPEGTPDAKDYIGGYFGISQLVVFQLSYSILKNTDTLHALMNSLIQFEKQYYTKELQDLSKTDKRRADVAKFTCSFLRVVGNQVIPPVLGIVCGVIPTVPMNILTYPVASWIIVGLEMLGGLASVPEFIVALLSRTVTSCVNALYWSLLVRSGSLVMQLGVVISLCLTSGVSLFQSKMQRFKGQNKTSGLENDGTLVYRQVQILTGMYNKIFSWILISILVAAVVGQVVSAFQLVRGFGQSYNVASLKEVGMMAVCALCLPNAFIITHFEYGFCAEVHDTSKACLEELQRDTKIQRMKIFRRQLKSFPVVKVNFAFANFIEKTTPVVYQQFVMERLVDLLLIS